MKPLGRHSFAPSMKQKGDGKWVKLANRIMVFPPLALAIEVVEGPMTGTKMANVYPPKQGKTRIDVSGDFQAPRVPSAQLEGGVRPSLGKVFDEDAAAVRRIAVRMQVAWYSSSNPFTARRGAWEEPRNPPGTSAQGSEIVFIDTPWGPLTDA
jgi:hypothetical protein